MTELILNVIKITLPAFLTFIVGILITPVLTRYMYKYKMWKKASRSHENTEEMSPTFIKIHNEKSETSTPRVGGVIVWLSVAIVSLIFSSLPYFFPGDLSEKLNFLSRNQTILPLALLLFASIMGLVDDFLQIYGKELKMSDGISRTMRTLMVILIGAIGAWWFYFKLENLSIHIPFDGDLHLGLWFVPFFILVVMATFSGSVIDGIDGLAAGVMSSAFVSFAVIAFGNHQIDLAAFCAVVAGGILSFLWFNIPPARFYLGETGMIGITVTLAVVAFLTNEVLVLPIVAFPLVITSLSSSIQMISKKYFGYKVFKIAPLHHHFEAMGWPKTKITMRYWVISIVCGLLGAIIALIS